MGQLICRLVANASEKEQAMFIRRLVFVEEQGLFPESDQDQHDQEAIHLVAEINGQIVGTVRLYEQGEGVWIGGRLAVLPQYRGRVGSLLVRRAVLEAEKQGAKVFLAQVQTQNERFFHRLGWRTVGERKVIFGREHVLMEAPLKEIKQGKRADNVTSENAETGGSISLCLIEQENEQEERKNAQ